ncbi:MAG: hypothetical protein A2270_02605 [Elusimicrobia bacterium RIFOXYA12_FULL_51_18]|nr:MAG: hypothetical protein A2270_02605 [Elusimicrobia bacterium RIFOXYA12_FULL_51_18]OGS31301.1 MAG: hypothetical protein A2218_08190 [Elusimicrobia bacterium RIFOXYA2_FULL_53_38]
MSIWKDFLRRHRNKLNELLTGRKFYSESFLNQKAIIKRLDALFLWSLRCDLKNKFSLRVRFRCSRSGIDG